MITIKNYQTNSSKNHLSLTDAPGRPGRPHVTKVSDKEAYMIWEDPEEDGNSYVLAYRVDWHRPGK